MNEMILEANTLYKVLGPYSRNEGVISIKGTPSVYINIFMKSETQPTDFSELVDSIDADPVLSAGGLFSSTAVNRANYIGFSGTGIVKVRGILLKEVVE